MAVISREIVREERHYGFSDRYGYEYCADHQPENGQRFAASARRNEYCHQCGRCIYDIITVVEGIATIEHVRCKIF